MFTILDYSSALEYSIIRRYTNIVYYYYYYYYVLYAVLCVRVSWFVMRGCAVSRRYINVCNCDMLGVVNVHHDHLKLCVVCIDGRRYLCCSECNVVSKSVMSPPPAMCNMSARTVVKLCTLCVFSLGMSF